MNRWILLEPLVWLNDDRAHLWTVLEGTVTLVFNAGRRVAPIGQSGREGDPDAIEVLHEGDSILVPAMCSRIRWTTEGTGRTVLLDVVVT
jgi:mannose-6-phosphate isomerase-like protein (cupin superfamily)